MFSIDSIAFHEYIYKYFYFNPQEYFTLRSVFPQEKVLSDSTVFLLQNV